MSGHNKWSKIKHKKAATDAQKSKIFGRLVKLIKIEMRSAGSNPDAPNVRAAIEKARAANMPKDNIDRALKSSADAESLTQATYEAYGPGGVALIIETVTDNTNRTGSEIRTIFTKRELSLANPGSATWAFTKTDAGWEPQQTVPLSDEDGEKLADLVEAIEEQDDVEAVYVNAE